MRIHEIYSDKKQNKVTENKENPEKTIKDNDYLRKIEERLTVNEQHLKVLFDSSVIPETRIYFETNEEKIDNLIKNYAISLKSLYGKKLGLKNKETVIAINGNDDNTDIMKFTIHPDKFLKASEKILLLSKLQKTNSIIDEILNNNYS